MEKERHFASQERLPAVETRWVLVDELVQAKLTQEVINCLPRPDREDLEEIFCLLGRKEEGGYSITHIVAFPQEDWKAVIQRGSTEIRFTGSLLDFPFFEKAVEKHFGQRVDFLGLLHTHPSGRVRLSQVDVNVICEQSRLLARPLLAVVAAPSQTKGRFELVGIETKAVNKKIVEVRRLKIATL